MLSIKRNVIDFSFFILTILCFFRFKSFAVLHLVGFLIAGYIVFILFSHNRIKLSNNIFICYLLVIALALFSYYISGNPSNNNLISYVLNYSLPVFYIIVANTIFNYLSVSKILIYLKKIYFFLSIYLIIELVFRFYFIITNYLATRDLLELYVNLKTKSIAYSDCNYLGLFILMVFCLSIYLYIKTKDLFFCKYIKIFLFFGFTSISRSVMITMLAILWFWFLYKSFKNGNFVFFVFCILLIPFSVMMLYNVLLNDASFRSKVVIFKGLQKIHTFSLNNVLFGFGYGKGEFAYSFRVGGFGHTHVALILGQVGVIGGCFIILWFLYLNFMSYNKCIIFIFAFILSGFSLSFMDSSLFFCISLVINMEKKLKKEKGKFESNRYADINI